ncbi:MAG TPA: hypothetical protein PLE19_08075 [Planctomycetota bacterium]|nr:hypothetical protein [Planctomycetota bacterium]HRR80099.1 hypothetical protein [Planctomycetota bacterium]HRT93785.1 hypothetical protein [Planctomycetota bacterium]
MLGAVAARRPEALARQAKIVHQNARHLRLHCLKGIGHVSGAAPA